MDRARRAGIAALVGILLLSAALAGTGVSGRPPGVLVQAEAAAAVGWPASSGLVVAEVITGGTSASDEWIEIANVGSVPLDLVGLELAYASSSGATVTRKATWAETLVLGPGRHLLLANAAGVHAAIADLVYSGGLSAAGGALVLRAVGGDPLDAVGWGDAVNAFVEGVAAPPPPAGSSLERRPGGPLGHATDSNDNAADFAVNPLPIAQDLASPPTPDPGSSPTPDPGSSPTPDPGSSPSPAASAEPSGSPDPSATPMSDPSSTPDPGPSTDPLPSASPVASAEPSPEPSSSPAPSASPSQLPGPTAVPSPPPSPTPTAPPTSIPSPSPSESPSPLPSASGTPTPGPSDDPSPEPSPPVIPSPSIGPLVTDIAAVRSLPDGASATVEAILTTDLGGLESGRSGFVQDTSAGIAVYLDRPVIARIPAGTLVRATGTVDERYGQRTLRVAVEGIADLGPGALPAPIARSTGGIGEPDEGRRMAVSGEVVESPTTMADGLGLLVDDGSGSLRIVVSPAAAAGRTIDRGDHVLALGPVGQRDSTGTGTAGYRLFATLDGELVWLADPSPMPSPTPSPASPTPSPTAKPSPVPSGTPSPAPSSAASPTPSRPPLVSLATARLQPVGTTVRIIGIVTVEPGRLGKPSPFAIDDGTAGIIVHLPDDAEPPDRGQRIEVTGKLAAPYGQLEIKPAPGALVPLGWASPPAPLAITATALGEGIEARLVTLHAAIASAPRRATSGDLTIDVTDASGAAARVMVDARAGIEREAFVTGGRYSFTGIVGQRATRIGALDGYRIWLRDRADLEPEIAASPSPGTTGSPGSSPSPSTGPGASADPAILGVAGALATPDVRLGIEAVVIAGPALLDASGRRIVVQDPTGAIEVLMPDALVVGIGDRVRATGVVGTAYGAPRLRADALTIVGRGGQPEPIELSAPPGATIEWRLARARGLVVDVRRMGERWSAELQVAGERVLVSGLPGSGIEAGRLPEGSMATVIGIVRRPYPSATDRRFSLVPRSTVDVSVTAGRPADRTSTPVASQAPGGGAGSGSGAGDASAGTPRIDLGQLGEFRGRMVQVGGLVVERGSDGVLLDDGTARAWLLLRAQAAALLPDLAVGDAVSATGTVEGAPGAERLVVDDPTHLVLAVASVPEPVPVTAPRATTAPTGPVGAGLGTSPDEAGDQGRPVAAGLVAMIVLLGLGGVLLGHRRLERRRLAGRVAARLGALARDIPSTDRASIGMPAGASAGDKRAALGVEPPSPS